MDTDVKSRRPRRGLAAALLGGCLLALLGSFAVRRAGSPNASRAPERDSLSRALEGVLRGLAEGGGKGAGGEAQDMIGEALSKVRAGAGGGAAAAGAIGAAEGLKGSQPSCGEGAACSGSAASGAPAPGAESAEGGDAEAEEERLRKVRLEAQERSLERSSAGLGGPASSALLSQSVGRRASGGGSSSALGAGAEERLAGMFRDFIKKLNAQAAAKGPRADRGGEYGAGGGRQDGGGPAPVVRADKGSPLMASPSFRSLLSVGKDGAHGVSLHQRGMTDGSKDRAGKNFDGHFNTYSPIPIEKAKGAFGQSSIRSRQSQPEYSSPK